MLLPLLVVSFMAALTLLRSERRSVYRGLDVAASVPAPRLPQTAFPSAPMVAAVEPSGVAPARAGPVEIVPDVAPAFGRSSPAPGAKGDSGPRTTLAALAAAPTLLGSAVQLPVVAANLESPRLMLGVASETAPLTPVEQPLAMLASLEHAPAFAPLAPQLAPNAARDEPGAGPSVCSAEPPAPRPVRQSVTPAAFGHDLASAALSQIGDLVIYNDTYRHMAYPMGDVPTLYGVCTDVVIRAYRAVGVDLQQLVHESGLGSGDTSIEHRRVETLRRFFARYGEQLPVTAFAEDYQPGDVVTYYRPQNAHSRTHIAIVSNEVGASGRYKIVHNRGWGPQAEDALFVDEITGHYRYWTAPQTASAKPSANKPSANKPSASESLASAAGVAKVTTAAQPVRLVRAGLARPRPDGTTVRGLGR